MPQFGPNLTSMFKEHPFLDRFAAAAEAGFRAVEFTNPFEHPKELIAQKLQENDLRMVMFNAPSGLRELGELGFGALPGKQQQFDEAIDRAIEYAQALGNRKFNVHAGIIPTGLDIGKCEKLFVENLRRAARKAAGAGLTLMVENLNSYDMPGYLLMSTDHGRRVIDKVGEANVKLEFDIYHCQLMEGNVSRRLRELRDYIGHVQIAGVPGRHEPDVGELNYRYIFDVIDEIGYRDFVGLAYRPQGTTVQGLGWLTEVTRRPAT